MTKKLKQEMDEAARAYQEHEQEIRRKKFRLEIIAPSDLASVGTVREDLMAAALAGDTARTAELLREREASTTAIQTADHVARVLYDRWQATREAYREARLGELAAEAQEIEAQIAPHAERFETATATLRARLEAIEAERRMLR